MASVDSVKTLNDDVEKARREGYLDRAIKSALSTHQFALKHLGEAHEETIRSVRNLGCIYFDVGNYSEAERAFKYGLAKIDDKYGNKSSLYGDWLSSIGMALKAQGKYQEAENLYLKALEIILRTDGTESQHYVMVENNLALLYKVTGAYSKVGKLYTHCVKVLENLVGKQDMGYAVALNNLGGFYRDIKDYENAIKYCILSMKVSTALLGENHLSLVGYYSNIGQLFVEVGNLDLAEAYLYQALTITYQKAGLDHIHLIPILINCAELKFRMEKYEEAEPLYLKALSLIEKNLGNKHPDYALILNNLAAFYQTQGNIFQAENYYWKAIDALKTTFGEWHPLIAKSLSNMALLYVKKSQMRQALLMMKRALEAENRMIDGIFSVASDDEKLDYISSIKGNLEFYITVVMEYFKEDSQLVSSTMEWVLLRKGISSEISLAQRDLVISGRYPELKQKFDALRTLRLKIAARTLEGPNKQACEVHQEELLKMIAGKAQLEIELSAIIPELGMDKRLKEANCKALTQALPKDTVLVEYIKYQQFNCEFKNMRERWLSTRYAAFVLKSGHDKVEIYDLGEAEKIDDLIGQHQKHISDVSHRGLGRIIVNAGTNATETSVELESKILWPLLTQIEGSRNIILSTDGEITSVSFEILKMPNGVYAIDSHDFSYVTTARDVLKFIDSIDTTKINPPIIIADPDFDLEGEICPKTQDERSDFFNYLIGNMGLTTHFPKLPGTADEGKSIGQILKVNPWLGKEATEGKVKRLHSPELLHIATHGYFLERATDDIKPFNPLLLSGLVFVGANAWLEGRCIPEEAEDGFLTAEDVRAMDLIHTKLVVLSGCETGKGEVRSGEGVFGLCRGFALAGTRNLILSLWKVADLPTMILMEEFYLQMFCLGKTVGEALKFAKLKLRDMTINDILLGGHGDLVKELSGNDAHHKPFEHPFYWGAFICQGNVFMKINLNEK